MAAPATGAPQDDKTPAQPLAPIRGYVTTRLRTRSTSGADDQDFDTVLSLDFGNERTDKVSAHMMARIAADLEGTSPSNPFFSLSDTFNDNLAYYLYYAWVDLRPAKETPGHVERWRLGRQIDYLTPEVAWFDGVSAQTRASGKQRVQLGAYAGVPTHIYDTSTSGDSMLGAWVQAQPWKDGRVRADWMYLEDETRLPQGQNDLVSLSMWQSLSPRLQFEGRYTHLESESRDVRVQANWFDPRYDLTLFVSYFELLREQQGFALDVDPLLTSTFAQFPYREARVLASKALSDSLLLQGGTDVRRVSDDSDIGDFNHDFERTYLTATHADLLPMKLSLSLTGEVWNSPDDNIQTWGADVSRRFGQALDTTLGSYFALYKYDYFTGSERDDVRTYFMALRWRRSQASTFDLRYEFEDNEYGDFQTLRLGATWQL